MDYVSIQDIRCLATKLNAEPAYQHEDEDFYVGVTTLADEIEELQRLPQKKGYWRGVQKFKWIYAQCSECGTVHDVPSNFCPDCGIEMESKELKMEPENKIQFNGMVNGVPAFTGTLPLEFNKERAIEHRLDNNDGIAFICLANIDGFATYGIEQTKAYEVGHGPGYIWSSRATVMNKVFDVALIDALYKVEGKNTYMSCAIDLNTMTQLLDGSEYGVDICPRVTEEDIHYDVKRVWRRDANER